MRRTIKKNLKRTGVLGWPVDHSLSPRVHGFWLQHADIKGEYLRVAVKPENFETTLRNLQINNFIGCNITVPYKEIALTIVDEVHSLAQRIGAINTVVVRKNGSLYGFNTDGFGFLENLRAKFINFKATKGPACVLGAGGAARAVVAALLDAGAPEVRILNRTQERAERLAEDLSGLGSGIITVNDWKTRADHLEGAALLVNTTTLGMTGQSPLTLDLSALPLDTLVTDIVYTPLQTDLLARAQARGNPVVDGLGMLLHQARPGFKAWFGFEPDVSAALRAYVLEFLS